MKVCARCSSELSAILNGNTQNESAVPLLSSEVNTLSIKNEINDEVQSCEMTLNQGASFTKQLNLRFA